MRIKNCIKRYSLLFLLSLILLPLCGCARSTELKTLPAYPVEKIYGEVYSQYLDEGAGIEAYDPQAVAFLKAGLAKYWYPQFLATVVIAVDRDKTNVRISGFGDLFSIRETIGISNANLHGELLMIALAYGLEGEGFTIQSAAELWFLLQAENRLESNSFEAPVVICYDYQAVAQNKSGRNLEIIVPPEGTLTYEKGVLSNSEFKVMGNIDSLLLSEGFRLADGRCDNELYPDAKAYENAARIVDYDRVNAVYRDATDVLRRNVLYTRLNTSEEGQAYQLIALIYCVIVAFWIASVMRRAMQKEVRRAAFLSGILLLGWATVRLVNYQLSIASDISRYLWYGSYLFQLTLPAVLLWLALSIDRHEAAKAMPKWPYALAALNVSLFALIMTNDLHNLVFRLDTNYPNWSSEYGYGIGFYCVMAGCIIPLAASMAIMLARAARGPHRFGLAFPLILSAFLAAYGAAYIMRAPSAWESDAAMVIGIFALLFFETAIRAGMIPVNSKYSTLFAHSPLSMQIVDRSGSAALSSENAKLCDAVMYESVAAPYRHSITYDENTLLFSDRIPGGHVLWKEDISSLNRLQKELEGSVRKIQAANAILAEEEKIRRAIDGENARTALLEQLDSEIARHTIRLAGMIERLKNASGPSDETARIALLLCYIKRRCNLFFRERETGGLPHEEIKAYIDELAEMAGHSGVRIIVACELNAKLPTRQATLFYDFFYAVIDRASHLKYTHITAHIGPENEDVTLRLLLPEDARSFLMEPGLSEAIASAGGIVAKKDLGGAIGLSLSFGGGVSDD